MSEKNEIQHDENQLIAQRREKLNQLRENGTAYPNDFRRTHSAGTLNAEYENSDASVFDTEIVEVKVAGRMMAKRIMGKASFSKLRDQSGDIQLFLKPDIVGEQVYEDFKHMDIGDIVGIRGELFFTKTGELTIRVLELRMLAKSLRPLPEKFHGMTDQEMRYRQRYVDLIMNEQSRNIFKIRAESINFLRSYLNQRGYMEIESPIMQVIPGGAAAKPFVTHHNVLDRDLYLRVAQELYIKRCLVGGFDKVYELNRNFRNEGLSTRHNPEFTMLEFNEAFVDYVEYMDMTEDMIRQLAIHVLGTARIEYQDHVIDMETPFARITMAQAVNQFHPSISVDQLMNLESAREVGKQYKIEAAQEKSLGQLQVDIFELLAEEQLIQPTFIIDYPIEISPLSRPKDDNNGITDRFELFIAGRELANGFSELNDPEDQAARFMEQVDAKDAGDEEAMFFDADYIRAMEYGLPPNAGSGIGIDRLIMLLTNTSTIRDVILFPHMRPEFNPDAVKPSDS